MNRPYTEGRTERLEYIQAMLGQLRTMAKADQSDMLAYFIEMAYVEAGDIIRADRSDANSGAGANRHGAA